MVSCKNQLKSNRTIQSSFKKLTAKHVIKKTTKKVISIAKPITSTKIAKLKNIGRRQVATVKRLPKLNSSVTGTVTKNTTRAGASQNTNTGRHHPGADRGTITPKITKTIPGTMAPGISVAINGQGFSDQKGSVQLKINNMNIDAVIDTWDDHWITLSFPENITLVPQTDSAQLIIRKKSGEIIRKITKFIPKMARRIMTWFASSEVELDDLFLLGEAKKLHHTILFRNVRDGLQNQWLVSRATLTSNRGTDCRFNHSSRYPVNGDANVISAITWSTGWMEAGECKLTIEVEGPAGLEPVVIRR